MIAAGAAWFVYFEMQAVLARQEAMPQTVDLSKQETQQYTNATLGVTMTVPAQWDIVSKETIAKLVRKRRDTNRT